MSINVTVNGNPVSISRGKMMNYDHYTSKQEFDKRRLMRLEQVRQQSKDLAENVRNKVRREKNKQMVRIQQEGKEKLKNWQNRKLLELQNQYQEALDEIGLAHTEAHNVENEEEILNQKKEEAAQLIKERGRVAAGKLQVEKNEVNFKKALPIHQKKIVRDIENTRAALISNITKYKKPISKHIPEEKTVKVPELTDSELGNTSDQGVSNSSEENLEYPECESSSKDSKSSDTGRDFCLPRESHNTSEPSQHGEKFNYVKSIEERRDRIDDFRKKYAQVPFDTRISEHIKHRERLASQLDFCDIVGQSNNDKPLKTHPHDSPHIPPKEQFDLDNYKCVCPKYEVSCPCAKYSKNVPIRSISIQTDNELLGHKDSQEARHISQAPKVASAEIPSKPGVKLNEAASRQPTASKMSAVTVPKVSHYDFPNRFHSNLPSTSQVEKITVDSIEALPNIVSEDEWCNKVKQRDKEAQIRGKRALEKEFIRKDYEEMMKKLPLLQRKEHIAEIGKDKPEYHMSEERLIEQEKKKQLRLENAYTKALPNLKPAIITIPSTNPKIPSNQPFEILEPNDSRTLNLGKWNNGEARAKMFSTEEVHEIIKNFTAQKQEDRHTKLKQLLESLKLQKEQLLNEIRTLPKDDSINALIDDLNSFTESDEILKSKRKKKEKSQRKRRHEDSDSSSSTESRGEHKIREQRSTKAKKSRPRVLILQNTSTQTTPKASKEKVESKRADEEVLQHAPIVCKELHTPCDCNKENIRSSEELCQILIKLHNDENPQVEVVSGEKKDINVDSVAGRTRKSSPKKVVTKSVSTETETFKRPSPKDLIKKVSKSQVLKDVKPRSESWKEQLSKNSISTSSTSYLSPPDFSKPKATGSTDLNKDSFYYLRRKPQQTNMSIKPTYSSSRDQTSQPDLIMYVRKLLSMSKLSVDELNISSSDVQTPSQSVIEIESNNPLARLHDIIRYINLKSEGIAKEINYFNDESGIPPNSLTSNEDNKTRETVENIHIPEKDTNGSSRKSKDSLLCQYADVTDSCSKRIANLAAMIEKIRNERISMHQSPQAVLPETEKVATSKSERDYSTAYLELPHSGERSKEGSSRSSSVSMDDEEFKRRILEVDISLAEKLKTFQKMKSESREYGKIVGRDESASKTTDVSDSTDREFLERLRRLIEENDQKVIPEPESSNSIEDKQQSFVPFLLDIPKLPILQPQVDVASNETTSNRRHPPPSKGLTSAKRFNGNISLVPHELSTIAEADSQLSTKVPSPKVSPSASKTENIVEDQARYEKSRISLVSPNIMPSDDFNALHKKDESESAKSTTKVIGLNIPNEIEVNVQSDAMKQNKSIEGSNSKCDSGPSLVCFDKTCSSSASRISSSSSEDLKSLEDMLRSINMEWAIPVLHKTQEALALSSSSSSIEMSSRRRKSRASGESEVSLKDFLHKQIISKISSSSLKSDASPSPSSFLKDVSDISAIQRSLSVDSAKQKTSTPLGSKKSKELQNMQVTGRHMKATGIQGGSSSNESEKQDFKSLTDDPSSTLVSNL
ncbi:uncharacterized protein LOC132697020 [Cylas formicarius]|uniref:uncharacterized protein LOC132697020 n=1 Tax=Cylas formicarius TaxID=197179 RepID=UPI002958778A|nr:uncharacterized protein LOC132697020 [Cylas formicarius]